MSYWDTHEPPPRVPLRDRIPPNFHEPTYDNPGDRSKMFIVLTTLLIPIVLVGFLVYGSVFANRPDLSPAGFQQRQQQEQKAGHQDCPQCDFGGPISDTSDQSGRPQGD